MKEPLIREAHSVLAILLFAYFSPRTAWCENPTEPRKTVVRNFQNINVVILAEEGTPVARHLREHHLEIASDILKELKALELRTLDDGRPINVTMRCAVLTYPAQGLDWGEGTTDGPPITAISIRDESLLWRVIDDATKHRMYQRGALNRMYVILANAPSSRAPKEMLSNARAHFVSINVLIPSGKSNAGFGHVLSTFGGRAKPAPMIPRSVIQAVKDDLLERAEGIPIELHLLREAMETSP